MARITREVRAGARPRVSDPAQFATDWRAQYQPAMEQVRSGDPPVLQARRAAPSQPGPGAGRPRPADVDEAVRAQLNLAWHRLDAWPDVAPACGACASASGSRPAATATSRLMVDLARRNGLPWDAILGAELARDYKPQPVVYLRRGRLRLRAAARC
jgi:2-haloacid dehalogenase